MKKLTMMVMIGLLGFVVQAHAVGGGTLSTNSGWYAAGATLNVTATPDSNSVFDVWLGDTNGATITGGTNIEITVNSALSITGRFSHITHSIAVTAGAGGWITPSGPVTVDQGDDQAFTINSSNNYHIVDVSVDSSSKGIVSGYTFSNVMAGHTIEATFAIDRHSITFDSAGGSAVASITNDYGSAVSAPSDPTREGYTFNGWNPTVPATIPSSDTTCVAQWTINQYSVTFDSAGGSAVANITNDFGTAVSAPSDPTKEGYTFTGWNPTVPATIPSSDTTCVAQWTINQYSVTFDSAGGSAVANITNDFGTAVSAPSDPTKEGYTFTGWSPTVPTTIPSADTTCVAQWTINQYEFTVVSEHGTGDPVAGVTTNDWNTGLTASIVDSPETNSLIRYVCTGWTATGTAPSSGTGTNMSFTITNDTVITWQWQTNYWVDFTVIGN